MGTENVNAYKIFLTDSRISEDGRVIICGQYSADEDRINVLMENIKSQAANFRSVENLKNGDLCLALFAEDGQFYRGQIRADFGNLKTVEFIDYGNTQNTKTEDLRHLPDDFRILERQSHSFVLIINAEPVDSAGIWTPAIPAAILNESLYAEVEIEETDQYQGRRFVKCPSIDTILFSKKLVKDSIMYPLNIFPKDSKFEAYISNYSSDGIFHVQPRRSENDLNKLKNEMAQFYKGDNLSKMLLPSESISVGSLVCSVYSADGGYYRGQLRQMGSSDQCIIHHIDYGDSEEKSACNLYKLPEKFCLLNYQALNCTLGDVTLPKDVSSSLIVDTINNFAQDKVLSVYVKDYNNVTGTLAVNMEDVSTKTPLLDFLVASQVDTTKGLDTPMVEHISFEVDKKVNMILTHVEADGSFFCYGTSSEELLNEQLDSLYRYCTSSHACRLSSPAPGSLCCALFTVDGNWYRAQILEHKCETAIVRFIDYGNTEKCQVSSLLSLDSRFCKLPAQAVHCSLSADLNRHVLISTLTQLINEALVVEFVNVKIEPCAVRLYHKGNVVGLTNQSPMKQSTVISNKNPVITYKHRSINLGGQKEVVLTQVSDFRSLWCIIRETQPELGILTEEISEIYNSIIGDVYNFNPNDSDLGCPCVTFDAKDGLWYRSKILSSAGPDLYKVLYVDCGRIAIVSKHNIKIISEDLLKLPAFAIQFTVSSVISASSVSIPLEQCQNLLKEVENKIFVAVFNGYDREKDLYFAELHDVAGNLKPLKSLGTCNIPFLKVPTKSEVPIRITCIEDPDCIWVQLLDHQAELIVLTGKLNAYYNSLPQRALELDGGYSGQICCMKSAKTKNWCRGEIAYVYDNIIEVKFLDYGYVEAANISDAKVLMPEFFSLPTQSICCNMHNLKPSTSRWCNGSVRYIKEYVAKTGVSAVFSDKKSDTYSTTLIVSTKDEKFLLSKRLVDEGLAAWIDVTIAEKDMKDFNVKSCKNLDDSRTTSLTSPQKFMKPPQVFYTHPGISLIGAEVPVVVCEAALPSDFFVLPGNSDLKRTYEKLSRELKSYNKPELPPPSEMYVGMPCICILGRDCLRAAIVSKDDPKNPTVFLVDFGEKTQVSISSLKCITASHITCMPPVAIRCTLHGIVEPQNEFWSSKAMLHFSQFCKENRKDLVCTVHGCVSDGVSQFFMVKLNTPFRDITAELVEMANCKLASPMGNMRPPFVLKSYIYSNLGFSIGKEDRFYITHVERPDLFYSQLSSKFREIDDFMDKVQEYCSNYVRQKPTTAKDLAFSPPCFARYDDGKWYRAHFISCNPHSFCEVDVLFVDYGNLVTVPLANIILCEYKSGLAEMPIFAVPCCLSEIVSPILDTMEAERISNNMKQGLVHRQLLGVITGSTNGRIHLDLVDNDQRLNDEITGNVSPVVVSFPERDNRFAKDSTLIGKFKEICSIEPKTVHSVYVSEVTDPDNFHIRLAENDEKFNDCTAEVDGFYTAVRRQDYSVESLQNGNVVCAKHPCTLRWCRAVVLDCVSHGPNQVLVEFVDIGEKEVVSIEDSTKRLVTEMLRWPRMSLKCQLANVLPVAESWDADSIEYFVRTCQYVSCRIRFNTLDVTRGVWNIDMKIEHKNVAHMLVEDGFARFVKVPSSTVSSNPECIKTKRVESWTRGTIKKVYISHVESVDEVYLQLVESEESLNQLMDKLNDPTLTMKKVCGSQLKADTSYAAKYEEDGQYYRANVLSYDMSTSRYHIIYTDYGNTAFVKAEEACILPKQLTALPEQAIKCSIRLTSDVDAVYAAKRLEELAVSSHTYFAECITMDLNSSTYLVDFWMIVENTDNEKIKFCDFIKPKDQEETSIPKAPTIELKALNIPTGVETKVYVAQVDGPNKIWIQLSSGSQDLDEIMDKINTYCNGSSTKPKLLCYDVGSHCIAKYSIDNGWYRGMIREKKDSEDFAVVHFVDYGNAESVKVDDILAIGDRFVDLPMQAVLCKLRGIAGTERWTTNDTDDFVSRVSDVELTATFHVCALSSSVAEKSLHLPCYDLELVYPCGKSLNNEWNETLTNRSGHQILDGSGDTSQSATDGSKIGTTEKHIVTDRGDHVIVENLLVQTASLDFNTSIDVRTPLVNAEALTDLVSVEPRSCEDGYISHCESPLHFYVQLARLASELDQVYEKALDHANKGSVVPSVGGCYVAQSPDDTEWYRVKCISTGTNESKVSFIDYGNSATVKPDVIKPISDELKSFPVQAIKCKLYDFESSDTFGTVTDFFLDLTLEKDLEIEFIHFMKSNIWEVKLTLDGKDVCQRVKKELKTKLPETEKQNLLFSSTVEGIQIEAGCSYCVKIVDNDDGDDGNFCAILLSVSRMFTEHVQAELKLYEEGAVQQAHFDDLKSASVYLCECNSEWMCVRVIQVKKDRVKFVDVKTTKIFEKESAKTKFIEPSGAMKAMIEHVFVSCSLCDQNGVNSEKLKRAVGDEKVVIELVDFDKLKSRWIVKLRLIEEDMPEDQNILSELKHAEVVSQSLPSICVTNAEGNINRDGEDKTGIWIHEHFADLTKFFSLGAECLKDCPSVLAPLHVALMRSKHVIMSHLTDDQKLKLEGRFPEESVSDPLKRFSVDLAKTGSEILPPKKLKLDLDENTFENGQWGNQMFIVGDEFEAIISNIESPGLFYIRPFLVMSEPVINAEDLASKDSRNRMKKIEIDSFCIAKCINVTSRVHHWVRAVVEQQDGDNFRLRDIDTGEHFIGITDDIYPVGKNIEIWPSFCLQSSMAGIRPHGRKNSEWPDLAIKEFESLFGNIGLSDCVEVRIVNVAMNSDTAKNCFKVDVSINGVSVADTMVNLQVAERISDIDKENVVEASSTEAVKPIRGGVRKPFTDLMPNISRQNLVITPRSSDSDGESLPDFDLLAVPWKVIRTSIGDSHPESLSDSVFVSDVDDSFATSTAHPDGHKQLTTFKIYCSTVSSETSDDDTTLAVDSIVEKVLEGEIGPSLATRVEVILNEQSLSSSLLDILTPVTATSSECVVEKDKTIKDEKISDHQLSGFTKEMNFDHVAKMIVGEVFSSIEKEEMAEEMQDNECTIPDSLDFLSLNQNDNSESLFDSKEKSLLLNLALQPVGNSDKFEESSIVLSDSLYDDTPIEKVPAKQWNNTAVDDIKQTEEDVIHALENLHLAEIPSMKELENSNSDKDNTPANQNDELEMENDAKNSIVANYQEVEYSSRFEDLCEIPTPEEVEEATKLCDDKPDDKTTTLLQNIAVISNLHQDSIVTDTDNGTEKVAFEVENVIVADYQEVDSSQQTIELCEIPSPEDLNKIKSLDNDESDAADETAGLLGKVNEIDEKEILEECSEDEEQIPNNKKQLLPESNCEEDLPKAIDLAENVTATHLEPTQIRVECDGNNNFGKNLENTSSGLLVHGPTKLVSEVKNDESLVEIPIPPDSLTESPFTDLIKDQEVIQVEKIVPQCDQYAMTLGSDLEGVAVIISNELDDCASRSTTNNMIANCDKSESVQTTDSVLSDTPKERVTSDKEDMFEKLTAIPHEKAKAFSMEALGQELSKETGGCEVVVEVSDNDTIPAVQEGKNLKDSVEQCAMLHSHHKYICCLPKIQLEVGDTYSVTYMNSEDPHNIRLQFDMTTETEEWLDALRKVNSAEGVKSLNVRKEWEIDMMCLVQCPVDSSWERGRMLKVEDDSCTVELFDYGDILTSTLDRLREIPDTLCVYPQQTVHCSLGDAYQAKKQTQDGGWDAAVTQYLSDLLFCSSLKAHVLEVCKSETEESYVVQLILLGDGEAEKDVGRMLVDAGLALVTEEEDVEKKGEDEWSTMTDSAWETLLNVDVGSPDKMHSSNVDLTDMEDPWPFKDDQRIPKTLSADLPKMPPSEKDLIAVAHEVQARVIANALIIAEIKDEKSSSKRRRKSKDLYIDLEKIPQILVEAYESTEID